MPDVIPRIKLNHRFGFRVRLTEWQEIQTKAEERAVSASAIVRSLLFFLEQPPAPFHPASLGKSPKNKLIYVNMTGEEWARLDAVAQGRHTVPTYILRQLLGRLDVVDGVNFDNIPRRGRPEVLPGDRP